MSSIVVKQKRIGTQDYKLLWEKDKGFVVRKNGYIVNLYGRVSKKNAKIRFILNLEIIKTWTSR